MSAVVFLMQLPAVALIAFTLLPQNLLAQTAPRQPVPNRQNSALQKKLSGIIVPKLQLTDCTLENAFRALREAAKEADPKKEGFNVIISPKVETERKDAKLTLDIKDRNVTDALSLIATLGTVEISYEEFAVVVTVPPKAGR